MIFRAHWSEAEISLSVSGLPLGVPNRSLALRMGIAVRIAAMIPSTGLRPSSMRGMVACSPFVRHHAGEVLGEGLPADGAGEEDSNPQASTTQRYVSLAEVIVLRREFFRHYGERSPRRWSTAMPCGGGCFCRRNSFHIPSRTTAKPSKKRRITTRIA